MNNTNTDTNNTFCYESFTVPNTNGWIYTKPECFICGGEGYYQDFSGVWHECPKCGKSYGITWTDPFVVTDPKMMDVLKSGEDFHQDDD